MSSPRGEHPGERELRRCRTPFSAANSSTTATSSRFRRRFSSWKRGPRRRKSPLVQVVGRADPAGEEAAAERAVGDEADPELAHRRQDLGLGLARPERVLGLQRRDRVDGMRAPDRRPAPPRRGRGGAPCPPARARPSRRPSPRSASAGRRGAGSRGRSSRRRAARSDASQADADVLGAAVDAEVLAVRAADVAELRREHDLVAPARDRPADELLVRGRGRTCRPCRGR